MGVLCEKDVLDEEDAMMKGREGVSNEVIAQDNVNNGIGIVDEEMAGLIEMLKMDVENEDVEEEDSDHDEEGNDVEENKEGQHSQPTEEFLEEEEFAEEEQEEALEGVEAVEGNEEMLKCLKKVQVICVF